MFILCFICLKIVGEKCSVRIQLTEILMAQKVDQKIYNMGSSSIIVVYFGSYDWCQNVYDNSKNKHILKMSTRWQNSIWALFLKRKKKLEIPSTLIWSLYQKRG